MKKILIIIISIVSLESCARLPCLKKGAPFDKKLVDSKLPAITKVIKRAIASKKKILSAGQIRAVCSLVSNNSGDAWAALQEYKKEWGVSWKTIFDEVRCKYFADWHNKEKYMLTIFDMGLLNGMDIDFYYDILDELKEKNPDYLYKVFNEKIEYPTKRLTPARTALNLLERTCYKAHNSIMFSGPKASSRKDAIELTKETLGIFKEYNFSYECDFQKSINFADKGTPFKRG